eukprot:scaffold6634_cov158-Amphora_coffeaeformis.AAC.6
MILYARAKKRILLLRFDTSCVMWCAYLQLWYCSDDGRAKVPKHCVLDGGGALPLMGHDDEHDRFVRIFIPPPFAVLRPPFGHREEVCIDKYNK